MNVLDTGFRIKQAIGLTGYNVKEFCEKTSRSRVTTALWISGRGGLIKNKSLEDLCEDLKKCSVICSVEWLQNGLGYSPHIINTPSGKNKSITEIQNISSNLENIYSYFKNAINEKCFDFNCDEFFVVAEFNNVEELTKTQGYLIFIQGIDKRPYLGTFIDHCLLSKTIILKSFKQTHLCIPTNNIEKIGLIKTLILKKH